MNWDDFSEQRLALGDSLYPKRLAQTSDAPAVLRVLGSFDARSKRVAIVGTRNADSEAVAQAARLAHEFARAGWTVVSGGARGIDIAAHRGALDGDGKTIVVLPSGFSNAYPAAHRPTYRVILESKCALISELEEGVPYSKWHFAARNRIIAGLADAVIVVQAPIDSGALITATYARRMAIPVYAVPAAPWDMRGSGFFELVRQGAKICVSADDVLRTGSKKGKRGLRPAKKLDEIPESYQAIDDEERRILEALSNRPRHPDEVATRTGIEVEEVQRTILRLELAGQVEARAGGRYARTLPGFGVRGEKIDEQSSSDSRVTSESTNDR